MQGEEMIDHTKLTDRQAEILGHIRSFAGRHGYAPSIRDLMQMAGILSPNGMMCHLKALTKKGAIAYHPKLSRSIVIIGESEVYRLKARIKELESMLGITHGDEAGQGNGKKNPGAVRPSAKATQKEFDSPGKPDDDEYDDDLD
jgi:SOS-response transcriptional repressor LexA